MNLKFSLIFLTVISVVCDTMLLPFYPQFFQEAFGVTAPEHVGYYIAACCFTVMVTFPLWAQIAKRIHEVHIWVYTQIIAGCLGLACYFSTSLIEFWIVSQTMLVFKASYLLIYPFVLRLEEKDKHLGVVGLFSVLMHFGAIGGALLGGFTLQVLDPRDIYLIMAGGDAVQVILSLYLIRRFQFPFKVEQKSAQETTDDNQAGHFLLKLGVVTLMFYFSFFLIRPFFSSYWEASTGSQSEVLTGIVYSIVGWMALGCLLWGHFKKKEVPHRQRILLAFVLCISGLMLQSVDNWTVVILGRVFFGWALYEITVRLELLLFEVSQPENYASDFSKLHLFQNVGVLLSSFTVGILVRQFDYQMTFYTAAIGCAVTALMFYILFVKPAPQSLPMKEATDG
ncbi:MFS transporter [Algicola sagamiensis]|uniref:MFS transporter n=1 Tax=Algicola sagamiensis TaxID=163869 RepID=UPI0003780835|nr:MFS transporter [Algicola sagamiensis]